MGNEEVPHSPFPGLQLVMGVEGTHCGIGSEGSAHGNGEELVEKQGRGSNGWRQVI